MKIARVFPRKTNASPDDNLVFFDFPPPLLREEIREEIDEVHISITFTEDIDRAGKLYSQWEKVAPTKIGGPALDDPGGDFIPGRYLKKGYVITSRGCPNDCWFCDVHTREGDIRELPITEGWNVLDSNLLACSEKHIKSVFAMLEKQKEKGHKIEFTGGLESKLLTDYHVSLLWDLRPFQMFFAFDTADDLEPLLAAGTKLRYANFTRWHMRCYVLIGYKEDTFSKAEKRLLQAWEAGFMPMAMLYKDNNNVKQSKEWQRFQRSWVRTPIIKQMVKKLYKA